MLAALGHIRRRCGYVPDALRIIVSCFHDELAPIQPNQTQWQINYMSGILAFRIPVCTSLKTLYSTVQTKFSKPFRLFYENCEIATSQQVRNLQGDLTIVPSNETMAVTACMNGYLEMLQWYYSTRRYVNVSHIELAAAHGHLHLLKWFLKRKANNFGRADERAIQNGHLDIVKWMYSNHMIKHQYDCLKFAARYGQVEIFQWATYSPQKTYSPTEMQGWHWFLSEENTFMCNLMELEAASGGHVSILQCLDPQFYPSHPRSANLAAFHGHLEALQFLMEDPARRAEVTIDTIMGQAIYGNRLHILDYLASKHDLRPFLNTETSGEAAKYGHLHTLQWLRRHQCPWDINTTLQAVRHNRVEILQWIYSQNGPWDHSVWAEAVCYSDLEILKWLKSLGFTWNATLCNHAVSNDRLDTVRWAFENGCPWDALVLRNALAQYPINMDMLKYLLDHDCPIDESSAHWICERTDVLHWIVQHYLNKTPQICAQLNHLGKLQRAVLFGCTCDHRVFEQAVQRRSSDTVTWIIREGLPLSAKGWKEAADNHTTTSIDWPFLQKTLSLKKYTRVWKTAFSYVN